MNMELGSLGFPTMMGDCLLMMMGMCVQIYQLPKLQNTSYGDDLPRSYESPIPSSSPAMADAALNATENVDQLICIYLIFFTFSVYTILFEAVQICWFESHSEHEMENLEQPQVRLSWLYYAFYLLILI